MGPPSNLAERILAGSGPRRAGLEQAHVWADGIVTIAVKGSGDVHRDRLRLDTRKWPLSKVLPKAGS